MHKGPQTRTSLECSRWFTGEDAGIEFEPAKAHAVRQHVVEDAHHSGVAFQKQRDIASVFKGLHQRHSVQSFGVPTGNLAAQVGMGK